AYAGIPLTHRSLSSSVVIVTGHEDAIKDEPTVRWRELPRAVDTIVVLMGMGRLSYIVSELLLGGAGKDTEVAIIENGTTDRQKVVLGNLGNILKKVKNSGIKPPAVIVIGKVAALSKKLCWRDAGARG
ncbi:MAG: SAM-dependent methyltransferase, partial [Nitrososphaerales archaeon]